MGGTAGIVATAASFSSGGFSTSGYFTTPAYQAAVAKEHIASIGKLNAGLYNPTGRRYPDVSVQAESYTIFVEEIPGSVDGTATGASVFASIISLLNDASLLEGRSPLGFLNPFIYSTGVVAFSDITEVSDIRND